MDTIAEVFSRSAQIGGPARTWGRRHAGDGHSDCNCGSGGGRHSGGATAETIPRSVCEVPTGRKEGKWYFKEIFY